MSAKTSVQLRRDEMAELACKIAAANGPEQIRRLATGLLTDLTPDVEFFLQVASAMTGQRAIAISYVPDEKGAGTFSFVESGKDVHRGSGPTISRAMRTFVKK